MPKNALTRQEKEVQTISSLEVAEMVGKEHKNLLADIRGYIKEIEIAVENGELKVQPSDFFISSTYVNTQNKELPCYDCTKMGCDVVANKLQGRKGIIFTTKYVDRFNKMEKVIKNNQPKLTKKHELAIKIYDGGSDAIIAHKELVKIEVAEETAKLKDGTNKILSAKQVVELLGVRRLTTMLLHEWFVENGFGELVKFPYERNRVFQPSQKFVDYVAVKGYSFTGRTIKGNKVKVVYSTAMVDRLLDKHMASIVNFVKIRGKIA